MHFECNAGLAITHFARTNQTKAYAKVNSLRARIQTILSYKWFKQGVHCSVEARNYEIPNR